MCISATNYTSCENFSHLCCSHARHLSTFLSELDLAKSHHSGLSESDSARLYSELIYPLTLTLPLSPSLSLSLISSGTHTHTHARKRTHTHWSFVLSEAHGYFCPSGPFRCHAVICFHYSRRRQQAALAEQAESL